MTWSLIHWQHIFHQRHCRVIPFGLMIRSANFPFGIFQAEKPPANKREILLWRADLDFGCVSLNAIEPLLITQFINFKRCMCHFTFRGKFVNEIPLRPSPTTHTIFLQPPNDGDVNSNRFNLDFHPSIDFVFGIYSVASVLRSKNKQKPNGIS